MLLEQEKDVSVHASSRTNRLLVPSNPESCLKYRNIYVLTDVVFFYLQSTLCFHLIYKTFVFMCHNSEVFVCDY